MQKRKPDEVFGDAIERVGTIAKNYQTDVLYIKKPEGSILVRLMNLEFVKEESIMSIIR